MRDSNGIQYDITAVIPVHPERLGTRMWGQALASVYDQELPVTALAIAVDLDKEGAPATRQRALEMVRTPWVAFLDSDDYWYTNHLAVLCEAQRTSFADYVYTWFDVIGGTDPFIQPDGSNRHFTDPWDPENPRHTTITTMVRTELALEVGMIHSLPAHRQNTDEDWQFTQGCQRAGGLIYHVPNVRTWAWRHHGLNTSGLPDRGDAAEPSGRVSRALEAHHGA